MRFSHQCSTCHNAMSFSDGCAHHNAKWHTATQAVFAQYAISVLVPLPLIMTSMGVLSFWLCLRCIRMPLKSTTATTAIHAIPLGARFGVLHPKTWFVGHSQGQLGDSTAHSSQGVGSKCGRRANEPAELPTPQDWRCLSHCIQQTLPHTLWGHNVHEPHAYRHRGSFRIRAPPGGVPPRVRGCHGHHHLLAGSSCKASEYEASAFPEKLSRCQPMWTGVTWQPDDRRYIDQWPHARLTGPLSGPHSRSSYGHAAPVWSGALLTVGATQVVSVSWTKRTRVDTDLRPQDPVSTCLSGS